MEFNNRQLRTWVFMLYPDNVTHLKAIDILSKLDNSLYIKHIAKFDDNGEQINKEHYHCILRYDKPYWLSSLLKDLDLSEEDAHLFHSFRDFKKHNKIVYKTIDEYIRYLDHWDTNKPDKYNLSDFHGGLINSLDSIINIREQDKYMQLLDMIDFIKKYHADNFLEVRTWSLNDWYRLLCHSGFGYFAYSQWHKLKDIVKPYINIF